MAREVGVDLEKATINLFLGDRETLLAFYPAKGWTVAAREIINEHCRLLREKDSQEVVADVLNIAVPLEDLKGR